jgi:hypothetical protein
MEDITEFFIGILKEADSVDVAESEFKKMVGEDPELHKRYYDWCHEVGSTERHGFLDFCDEYLSSREEIWDNLSDYDE